MYHKERMEHFREAAKELGVTLCENEDIKPDDLYLAERDPALAFSTEDTGVKLLTCRLVRDGIVHARIENGIFPYAYDVGECCKVVE